MKIPFSTLITAMLCSVGGFATPEPPKTRTRDEGPGSNQTEWQLRPREPFQDEGFTPTGRIKTEFRPELQNLKPPRMPEIEPERRYARASVKSEPVPDKAEVKRQRQAKAKRKAKRGF